MPARPCSAGRVPPGGGGCHPRVHAGGNLESQGIQEPDACHCSSACQKGTAACTAQPSHPLPALVCSPPPTPGVQENPACRPSAKEVYSLLSAAPQAPGSYASPGSRQASYEPLLLGLPKLSPSTTSSRESSNGGGKARAGSISQGAHGMPGGVLRQGPLRLQPGLPSLSYTPITVCPRRMCTPILRGGRPWRRLASMAPCIVQRRCSSHTTRSSFARDPMAAGLRWARGPLAR